MEFHVNRNHVNGGGSVEGKSKNCNLFIMTGRLATKISGFVNKLYNEENLH